MYWGQAAVALAAAIGIIAALLGRGRHGLVALATGVVAYVCVRWTFAWGFRVRYWYRRGTRGVYSTSCPNCEQYIYRRKQDWILRCGRCEWTAGWPVVRWVTQSVPARQLRRTVLGPSLLVVVLATAVIVTGAVGGMALTAGTSNSTGGDQPEVLISNETLNLSVPNITATTPGLSVQHGYNRTLVTRHFFGLLNEERQSRGLQPLSRSQVLTEMGRNHSRDMAEHSYLGHVDSQGRTIQDRYAARGLLPECRLPIENSDRYYSGAENAVYIPVDTEVIVGWQEGAYYVENEQELARAIFEEWMHSPPHRRAMLVESADEASLGLYITEKRAYGSLELC